jgi:hypothetical protein
MKVNTMLRALAVMLLAAGATQVVEPATEGKAPAPLRVQVKGGLVDLHAESTPISTVLDQLAREIGTRVVYEDGRPQDRVSITLKNVTPREAVTRLLEGLGLSYAVRLGADPSRIELLVLSTRGAGPSRAGDSTEKSSPAPGRQAESKRDEQADEVVPEPEVASEPPRPPGLELPNEPTPPLPRRPIDLPDSPFIPYYGSLNPDAPDADANAEADAPVFQPPTPGEVVEMDGMGPDGVPTRGLKARLPEVSTAPRPRPSPVATPVPVPTPAPTPPPGGRKN